MTSTNSRPTLNLVIPVRKNSLTPSPRTPLSTVRMSHNIPHSLETGICVKPSICSVCEKKLWTWKAARCTYCKYKCHQQCSPEALPTCGLSSEMEQFGAVLSMFADLSHETSQQTVASAHTIDFPRTRLRSPPSPMLPPSPAKTNPELRLFDSDSDPDSIEIPFEQLKLNQLVGCGSFGKVHAATWHGKVAVKTLHLQDPSPEIMSAWHKEIGILRKIRHENVILFMGACTQRPNLALVTAFCENGSLFSHIHTHRTPFSMFSALQFMEQIAQGMDYLHARGMLHRDLKSKNVLLNENMDIKIADFGLSCFKTHRNSIGAGLIGSIYWLAPECLTKNEYTESTDVYAFGILMYELLAGRLPWAGLAFEQIVYQVGSGNPPIPQEDILAHYGPCPDVTSSPYSRARHGLPTPPIQCTSDEKNAIFRPDATAPIVHLMTSCYSVDPNNRLPFGEICSRITSIKYKVEGSLRRTMSLDGSTKEWATKWKALHKESPKLRALQTER